MLQIQQGQARRNCQGRGRRTALKAGLLGVLGLSLPDFLRLQAEGSVQARKDTAVILLWLDGGPSQLETYDPKPDAPAEYRGPFGVINTNVPGIRLSEMLPRHARHADQMVFVRSLHHATGDHFAGAHWMLTGRFGATTANKTPRHPSVGSYTARVRGPNQPGLPAYVGLPAAESVYLFPGYQGAAYLGSAYDPFDVDRQQKYLPADWPGVISRPKFLDQLQAGHLAGRRDLLHSFDTLQRHIDRSGVAESMDRYQHQALAMILSGKARDAFDLDKEPAKVADRYGKSPWGRYTLLARRLVEAGVTFVTVDMPHWDHHSRIESSLRRCLPPLDQAVGALVEDLQQRGLMQRVLLVVMGEFGRTPRLNKGQPGIPVPGRDHWGSSISALLAGGGLRGGQVIGETNSRGEHPVKRPLTPADLLATVYHVLGIDPRRTFQDHTGRPHPILDDGQPIAEAI
ncbi:MAG TPA: DUF1501 domain-containing protein [Gemmataceae bacterium]|nr:DUF1501 domain-containing protein [Gemmataceae bacterium]